MVDGRFIGAPYVGFGLSGAIREHRLGYRLNLKRGEAVTFGLRIEATTRENSGDDAKAERVLMLSGEASW